jgi:hypothetical protein
MDAGLGTVRATEPARGACRRALARGDQRLVLSITAVFTLALAAGVVGGAYVGARVQRRVPERPLEAGLALALVLVGLDYLGTALLSGASLAPAGGAG